MAHCMNKLQVRSVNGSYMFGIDNGDTLCGKILRVGSPEMDPHSTQTANCSNGHSTPAA
jgi:hypothetical protein